MTMKNSQRGSMLIYSMLVMSSMLAIGLTLNSLFLSKLKGAAAARDSVVALYAADSAVEKCLFEARLQINQQPLVFASGATYGVASPSASIPGGVSIKDNCLVLGDSSFQFRAVGTYHGVRRSLEISQ